MSWWGEIRLHETAIRSLMTVAERYRELAHRHSSGVVSKDGGAEGLVEHILTRRMVDTGWKPHGRLSANGRCHLMPTLDGQWVAMNLARPGDVDILRAVLLENQGGSHGTNPAEFERAVVQWGSQDLMTATHDLGVPLSRVGEVEWTGSLTTLPVRQHRDAATSSRQGDSSATSGGPLKVLDLSSLWAGPLCTRLLRDAGCAVTAVESVQRPDPTRWRHPSFFAELHRDKDRVRLDFGRDRGRLVDLIGDCDVVIENSRPRALGRLGIVPGRFLATGRPKIWVSITGYGVGDGEGEAVRRVGFGDDCAAAGGLVDWSAGEPGFVGDAVADPVTGLVAATAVLSELRFGTARNGCHMQVSLAECANWVLRGGEVLGHRRD